MSRDEYVTLTDVEVGVESNSGLAVNVKIDGEWVWVPLSQVKSIRRDSRFHDSDSIEVSQWFAEKQGWV